jgi:ribosomal protein L30/L7E
MVGDGHMSHIRCTRNTFTHQGGPGFEDSPGWLGMVSHVSHSVHATQEHIYTKVGQGLRTVQDSWGWSHMSHICACTTQGTHLHQRWARIVEDSPGWLGMVSHVSHSVHVPPKDTFTPKVGPG